MPIIVNKKWTIYIIENRFGQYYTGICRDLNRRFNEHNSNGKLCAKALRGKGPLKLIYAAELDDHSSALKAEIWIKKLSKQNKIKLVEQAIEIDFIHIRVSEQHRLEAMQGK